MAGKGLPGGVRDDILKAAARLLGSARAGQSVTLRAIAREAGIAAPSIYTYFADRDAVLETVIAETFARVHRTCAEAAARGRTGDERVRLICRAYLDFAEQHPGDYRVLFERTSDDVPDPAPVYTEGMAALALMVDALHDMVAEGSARQLDPHTEAQLLWTALHGYVILRPGLPRFAWMSSGEFVDSLVARLRSGGSVPPLDDAGTPAPGQRRR